MQTQKHRSQQGPPVCFLFYKPFGVLSQFTKEGNYKTLKDFGPFPGNVCAAGRLDVESEGLLLLTNDNELKHTLTHPKFKHPRTYLVQVEGAPTDDALEKLREGIIVMGKETKPAEVRLLKVDPALPPRPVAVRFRKAIPTSWIEITLREGRNRQVRRMTAAVGFPTLRLVRIKIGPLSLEGLHPGESRPVTQEELKCLISR